MLKLGKNRVFSECAKKRSKLGSFSDSFRCWAIQYWEWMVCYWMHNLHHTAYSTIYLLSGYSWDFLINFFAFMLNDSLAQENSTGKNDDTKKTTNWIIRSVCLTNTIYNFRKLWKQWPKECQLNRIGEMFSPQRTQKNAHAYTQPETNLIHCFQWFAFMFFECYHFLANENPVARPYSMQICGTSVRNG